MRENVVGEQVLWNYYDGRKKGFTEDPRKYGYDQISQLSMNDLIQFHKECIAGGNPFIYTVFGDVGSMDLDYLRTMGDVKILTQDEVFGD